MDKIDKLAACPLEHHVSAGLKTYKTGRDPRIICLDCGLSLAAPDWTTVYERWQSRPRASVAAPPPDIEQDRCGVCGEYSHVDHAFYKLCNNCWMVMPWCEDGRVFEHKPYPYTCAADNEIIVTRSTVAAPVDVETNGLAAMFTELYNCYTASKCAAQGDREEYLRLKGMAEAYQYAAQRCREWPARRRNDGSLVAPSPITDSAPASSFTRDAAEEIDAMLVPLRDYGNTPGISVMAAIIEKHFSRAAAVPAVGLPRLPFICGQCKTQQHADGICANCSSFSIATQPLDD